MTQTRPTPTERMRAAAAASWQRPPKSAQPTGRPPQRRPMPARAGKRPAETPAERRARRLALAKHTSEGLTPAYLLSQEKSMLRELDILLKALATVRRQLAQQPTTT